MQPKVLMIAERFSPDIGGVARSAGRTSRRLTQLGYPCDVFCWTKALPPGQLETVPGEFGSDTVVHRFGMFGNFDLTMQHSMNVIEWLHSQQQFGLLWGHYLYPSGFAAVLLARTLGLPSIVSARGNDIDRLMFPPGDFARLQWTLSKATRVSAVSNELARKITVLDESIEPVVVHNSVDSETFEPSTPSQQLRESLGIYPQETVLAFCGELRHKKGLPFLLSALQQIRADRDACLLVIGTVRASEMASVQQYLAGDEATRKRVIVTGPLETEAAVAEHLALADAVLSPSVWDGLPNAALEAMACGKMVIASDAGGLPDVIENETNGFLVPKAHLNRFGEGVLECLDLPEARKAEIGQAARQRVLESFTAERELEQLRVLLDGVV